MGLDTDLASRICWSKGILNLEVICGYKLYQQGVENEKEERLWFLFWIFVEFYFQSEAVMFSGVLLIETDTYR